MEPKQHSSVKILLADDDKDDRFLFDLALQELFSETRLKTVPDGEQLMQYLSENVENPPDILFLDLNMPRKNGSECLAEIKKDEKLKKIPVIIYSTSLRDTIADVLYQTGAHYYLQKCDYSELKTSLQKVFSLLENNPNQPSRDNFLIK